MFISIVAALTLILAILNGTLINAENEGEKIQHRFSKMTHKLFHTVLNVHSNSIVNYFTLS